MTCGTTCPVRARCPGWHGGGGAPPRQSPWRKQRQAARFRHVVGNDTTAQQTPTLSMPDLGAPTHVCKHRTKGTEELRATQQTRVASGTETAPRPERTPARGRLELTTRQRENQDTAGLLERNLPRSDGCERYGTYQTCEQAQNQSKHQVRRSCHFKQNYAAMPEHARLTNAPMVRNTATATVMNAIPT